MSLIAGGVSITVWFTAALLQFLESGNTAVLGSVLTLPLVRPIWSNIIFLPVVELELEKWFHYRASELVPCIFLYVR